ncbi:MAG: GtrA family protein [Ruminococcaceae bacterium]|nr:GtrA family protein [Oscillospiraceae bacterium]
MSENTTNNTVDTIENTAGNTSQEVVPTAKQNFVQSVKFLLFSISAGLIQIGSFTLLTELTELPYWVRYLTSLVLSILWNFTLNRRYTFKSATNVPIAMLKVFGFYCLFTPPTLFGGQWLVDMFPGKAVVDYLVTGVTMILNFVLEFLFCRFFVYRKEMYTNDLGKAELEKMAQSENAES